MRSDDGVNCMVNELNSQRDSEYSLYFQQYIKRTITKWSLLGLATGFQGIYWGGLLALEMIPDGEGLVDWNDGWIHSVGCSLQYLRHGIAICRQKILGLHLIVWVDYGGFDHFCRRSS